MAKKEKDNVVWDDEPVDPTEDGYTDDSTEVFEYETVEEFEEEEIELEDVNKEVEEEEIEEGFMFTKTRKPRAKMRNDFTRKLHRKVKYQQKVKRQSSMPGVWLDYHNFCHIFSDQLRFRFILCLSEPVFRSQT